VDHTAPQEVGQAVETRYGAWVAGGKSFDNCARSNTCGDELPSTASCDSNYGSTQGCDCTDTDGGRLMDLTNAVIKESPKVTARRWPSTALYSGEAQGGVGGEHWRCRSLAGLHAFACRGCLPCTHAKGCPLTSCCVAVDRGWSSNETEAGLF